MEKLNLINTNFKLREGEIERFKEQGFVLLKQFFSQEMMKVLQTKIESHLASPSDKYQSGFNRVKYDIFDEDEDLRDLFSDQIYRSTIHKLSGRDMLHTQTLAFELKQNQSKGFPWHIGTQSFGFQKAEDFGCTLWTPMMKIDNKKQKGGMSYVPKNILSGAFMYDYVDPASFRLLQEYIDREEEISLEEFIELRDGPLNHPAMKRLLDYYAVADDFEIGDALLFDKYVIHKSVMLQEGPEDARVALAIRFIDAQSRYDQKRALDLEIPRKLYGYTGPTKYHLEVADKNNQLIAEGPLYRGKEYRLITAE